MIFSGGTGHSSEQNLRHMQPNNVVRSDKPRLNEDLIKLASLTSGNGYVERAKRATAFHSNFPERLYLSECVFVVYVCGCFNLSECDKLIVWPCRPSVGPMPSQNKWRWELIPETSLNSAIVKTRDDESVRAHAPRDPKQERLVLAACHLSDAPGGPPSGLEYRDAINVFHHCL